ncbi:hypothetical protein EDC38_2325 [Marinimicrobium koreense]|uniref:Excisionase family DNA binding protein n=2 Tax=Marinimicrobium koreense TaxID=306545 RepID=A0A3N1P0Y1_9GAMM|nr:hypothetical protein EDC38_2325 [Marinimicrobium koreense]
MTQGMTKEAAAERLNASEAFVQRMIEKGRLAPDEAGLLDPQRVDDLAQLLERLRENGVGTVIGLIDEELGPVDNA